MPSARKPIPLTEYDAAHDGFRNLTTILGTFVLAGLVVIAQVAFSQLGNNLPRNPDRWWKAMLAPSFVMAIGSPVVLWLIGSYRRFLRQNSVFVCPACEEVPWSIRAVRLTGCCDRCGDQMVALPETSGSIEQTADDLLTNQDETTTALLAFVLAGLGAFALGVLFFATQGRFICLVGGGMVSMFIILTGCFLVDRKARLETFECSNCSVDLRKDPKAVPWIATTGRCVKCAHIVLAVEEPSRIERRVSLAGLRNRVDFQGYWGLRLFLLFLSTAPLVPACLRFAGVPPRDLFGWSMWCVLPLFGTYLWWAAPLGIQCRCPLCRKSMAGFESIVIATGKCPHCLGEIAKSKDCS